MSHFIRNAPEGEGEERGQCETRIRICNEAKRVYIYVMRVPPTRPPARARVRKRVCVTRVPVAA